MITLIALINLSCILLWVKYFHDRRLGNDWLKFPFGYTAYSIALIYLSLIVFAELIVLSIVYLP